MTSWGLDGDGDGYGEGFQSVQGTVLSYWGLVLEEIQVEGLQLVVRVLVVRVAFWNGIVSSYLVEVGNQLLNEVVGRGWRCWDKVKT